MINFNHFEGNLLAKLFWILSNFNVLLNSSQKHCYFASQLKKPSTAKHVLQISGFNAIRFQSRLWPTNSRVVRDEADVTANYKIQPRLYFASRVSCIVMCSGVSCVVLTSGSYISYALYLVEYCILPNPSTSAGWRLQDHFWFEPSTASFL